VGETRGEEEVLILKEEEGREGGREEGEGGKQSIKRRKECDKRSLLLQSCVSLKSSFVGKVWRDGKPERQANASISRNSRMLLLSRKQMASCPGPHFSASAPLPLPTPPLLACLQSQAQSSPGGKCLNPRYKYTTCGTRRAGSQMPPSICFSLLFLVVPLASPCR